MTDTTLPVPLPALIESPMIPKNYPFIRQSEGPALYTEKQVRACMAPLQERADALEEALKWYGDEAAALAKHVATGVHTLAVLASVTVLALDAGNRARSLINHTGGES